ncbi:hypothetical protein FQN55_004168 [Onygenales sp. PD_40]|nr:hypothetical protein FQN55_004168 [Onygenales sp. PD_40]
MLTLLHPLYRTVSAPEILPAESAARKSLARAEVKAGGTPLSLALVAVCTVILYPAVTSNASEYRPQRPQKPLEPVKVSGPFHFPSILAPKNRTRLEIIKLSRFPQTLYLLAFPQVSSAAPVFGCEVVETSVSAKEDPITNQSSAELESSLDEASTSLKDYEIVAGGNTHLFLRHLFCGVNVIAYYSSEIFLDAGFSQKASLAASFGFGVINWLFAIPAVYTIDTFGRRNLLLTTFPLMGLFLLFTGFSFWIPTDGSETMRNAHTGCVALGIYLFGIVYSPGEGPVPFTYSAEAYPLYVRAYGMSLATATTWFFNFLLAITWPSLQEAFRPQGAFGWYAGWNIVGFVLVLLFMPETKGKTLEELDQVFSVPTAVHAKWGVGELGYVLRKYVLRQKGVRRVVLYERDDGGGREGKRGSGSSAGNGNGNGNVNGRGEELSDEGRLENG